MYLRKIIKILAYVLEAASTIMIFVYIGLDWESVVLWNVLVLVLMFGFFVLQLLSLSEKEK